MKISVAKYLEYVNDYRTNNALLANTPLGVFGNFGPTVDVVAVQAVWLAPGGKIVVISPLPMPGAERAITGKKPECDMTVAMFGQLLDNSLQKKLITGDTPIGVYHSIANGEVNVAFAKDIWVPPGGNAVVVSLLSFQEIMHYYGFDKPGTN